MHAVRHIHWLHSCGRFSQSVFLDLGCSISLLSARGCSQGPTRQESSRRISSTRMRGCRSYSHRCITHPRGRLLGTLQQDTRTAPSRGQQNCYLEQSVVLAVPVFSLPRLFVDVLVRFATGIKRRVYPGTILHWSHGKSEFNQG